MTKILASLRRMSGGSSVRSPDKEEEVSVGSSLSLHALPPQASLIKVISNNDESSPKSSSEEDESPEDPFTSIDLKPPSPAPSRPHAPRILYPRKSGDPLRSVSFAPTPSEENETYDPDADPAILIDKLRNELISARIDASAERALRKKKERNLIKLARQLNSRSGEMRDKDLKIEKLALILSDLQSQKTVAGVALSDLTDRYEADSRNHRLEINDQQERYGRTCRDYDNRISQLNAQHGGQCEELRRKALQANMEADAAQERLARLEMRGCVSPRDGEEGIGERVLRERSGETLKLENKGSEAWRIENRWGILTLLLIMAILVPSLTNTLPSSHICAPAFPGTILNNNHMSHSHEAPWWAPSPFKQSTFTLLCGDRPRTKIDSFSDGHLIIQNMNGIGGGETILSKYRLGSVIVRGETLILNTKKGTTEVLDAPWR